MRFAFQDRYKIEKANVWSVNGKLKKDGKLKEFQVLNVEYFETFVPITHLTYIQPNPLITNPSIFTATLDWNVILFSIFSRNPFWWPCLRLLFPCFLPLWLKISQNICLWIQRRHRSARCISPLDVPMCTKHEVFLMISILVCQIHSKIIVMNLCWECRFPPLGVATVAC